MPERGETRRRLVETTAQLLQRQGLNGTGVLEVLRAEYIRTARAKGLPRRSVIARHVLRNALLPMITVIGPLLPDLITGSIRYARDGLRIEVKGTGFTPIGGPVGFVQAELGIGEDLLRARFHNFRRNDASEVRSRKPSAAAAAGEAGFWDVLLGDDESEAGE